VQDKSSWSVFNCYFELTFRISNKKKKVKKDIQSQFFSNKVLTYIT